jgi:hypothetical protein
MVVTRTCFKSQKVAENHGKLSHRMAHLSVVLFVAGSGVPGAPQHDLSNGEGDKEKAKFATK